MGACAWTLLAGATGLLSSTLLSTVLRLERTAFVLGYSLAVLCFALVYVRRTGAEPRRLVRRRAVPGILGGLALGAVLVRGVITQPASDAPSGWVLVTALAWYGVVYGSADAILLNVIPVLAVGGRSDRIRSGVLGLVGSLLVTALYHLGFAEFRGPALTQPLIGNAIITAGYLATGNPLTPLLAHVMMHGAAVLHGMETTSQLPPHY